MTAASVPAGDVFPKILIGLPPDPAPDCSSANGRGARLGGGRLREAAADDGASVHHGVDRRAASARSTTRELRRLGLRARRSWAACGCWRSRFAFLIPLTFPATRARRSSARVWSSAGRTSTSSISTFRRIPSSPREQHCAGGGAVLDRAGHRADWRRAQGAPPRRAAAWPSAAISRATRFVTKLTPYGLFAIAANAAGTLNVEQLAGCKSTWSPTSRWRCSSACGYCRDWSRR